MTSYNDDEKRTIIMKHYLKPINRKKAPFDILKSSYHHSDSCADDITLYINKEKNLLTFEGNGCAIYVASTDLFIENLKNNEISLYELNSLYKKLINQEELLEEEKEKLGLLIIFKNVKNQMNRYECALMISKAIEKLN